jgi:hypothetical protein
MLLQGGPAAELGCVWPEYGEKKARLKFKLVNFIKYEGSGWDVHNGNTKFTG